MVGRLVRAWGSALKSQQLSSDCEVLGKQISSLIVLTHSSQGSLPKDQE